MCVANIARKGIMFWAPRLWVLRFSKVLGLVKIGASGGRCCRGPYRTGYEPVDSGHPVSQGLEPRALEPQKRPVPLPEEPDDGEEPEPDDGRVGGEDLAQVLRRLARVYDGDALVGREAGPPEALLGGVVEDDGADGLELAVPNLLRRVPEVLGEGLRGLDEEVVLGLLEPEIVVARAVAGGDGYLRVLQAHAVEVLADVGRAAHLDVVADLGAGRELAGVELLDAQDRRRPLEAVGEVGGDGGGGEGEDQHYKQAQQKRWVAPDPGPQAPLAKLFVVSARARESACVARVHVRQSNPGCRAAREARFYVPLRG